MNADQKTPLQIYNQHLQDGTLSEDIAQKNTAIALDQLFQSITQPRTLTDIIRSILKPDTAPQGLYLYGDVGRGKSMLMDLFYHALPDRICKNRVHFHEFMISLHDYLHAHKAQNLKHDGVIKFAHDIARKYTVLCFDEFHVTNIVDAMLLSKLFGALWEKGTIIVSTSNWRPDDLYLDGLQRNSFLPFIDMLKNHMIVLHLDSQTDYRYQKLFSGFLTDGVYFSPLNKRTQTTINQLKKNISGGVKPSSEILTIKNRPLSVRITANHAANFTFSELCESPLGAEDYLAISKRYSIIILENIPQLSDDQRNEAKRFMTLIDALYETKTHVIFTAAVKPNEIYTGHDHEAEFKRTVSRLYEMQTSDYLTS